MHAIFGLTRQLQWIAQPPLSLGWWLFHEGERDLICSCASSDLHGAWILHRWEYYVLEQTFLRAVAGKSSGRSDDVKVCLTKCTTGTHYSTLG